MGNLKSIELRGIIAFSTLTAVGDDWLFRVKSQSGAAGNATNEFTSTFLASSAAVDWITSGLFCLVGFSSLDDCSTRKRSDSTDGVSGKIDQNLLIKIGEF